MRKTSMFSKSVATKLYVILLLFLLFTPVFQAQATVGVSCVTAVCDPPANCKGGVCAGPCTLDSECVAIEATLGWKGSKCTGTPAVAAVVGPPAVAAVPAVNGVCLESPREGSRLPATAPATTGEELLAILNTATNWIFAIFAILSIIFVLLAALQFISSGGETAKVGEARQKLIWAMVGIAVALASKGLVPIVRSIIGG